MKGKGFWLLLFLLILCMFPTASAFNLSAKVGETWIIYQWQPGYRVNVYIDGIKQGGTNYTTSTDWYLTNINSDEKHQIKLFNANNTTEMLGSLTVTTLHSQSIIMILICVLILFFIILLFIKDPIKTILVGVLSAAISLYTSTISIGYGALTIIPLITLVISAIFIVYALWNIIIEKTQW
jgi:hypothetical protein